MELTRHWFMVEWVQGERDSGTPSLSPLFFFFFLFFVFFFLFFVGFFFHLLFFTRRRFSISHVLLYQIVSSVNREVYIYIHTTAWDQLVGIKQACGCYVSDGTITTKHISVRWLDQSGPTQ